MTAIRTARDRARAELTQEIKKAARRQLAELGPQGLSLRAVARELGMVSSALYRYFPSRDHLLTALIIDAYNAIGEAVEKADKPAENPRLRWHICWAAARAWARKHPHEYALIYGSPIPGYQAPQETVGPATRVALALITIASAWSLRPAFPGRPMSPKLEKQAREVNDILGANLLPDELSRLIIAWTQLFGTISFELFGQYANTLEPADYIFTYTADQLADFVGITGRDG